MRSEQEENNRESNENDQAVRRGWLPKLEFSFFDGDDVRIWLDNYESYFELYQIPSGFKVCAASMHLKGKASHWFQASRDIMSFLDWSQFRGAVLNEFDMKTHSDKMLGLLTLRQNGSLIEYKNSLRGWCILSDYLTRPSVRYS